MRLATLTLGTAQLGMPYGVANAHGMPDEDGARAIVSASLAQGIRSFDTAPAYGVAEERVGRALASAAGRALEAELEIATKLPNLVAAGVQRGGVGAAVSSHLTESLRKLGKSRVEHYLLHAPRDLEVFGAELVDALAAERDAGRIVRAGASIYSPDDARRVLECAPLTSIQVPLHMLDRRLLDSGLLSALRKRGVFVFARSAFLQGAFSLDPAALPPRLTHAAPWLRKLRDVCRRLDVRPVDVALAWVRSRADVDSVVVGIDDPAQVATNIAASERPLPRGLDDALAAELSDVPLDVVDPSRWPSS